MANLTKTEEMKKKFEEVLGLNLLTPEERVEYYDLMKKLKNPKDITEETDIFYKLHTLKTKVENEKFIKNQIKMR